MAQIKEKCLVTFIGQTNQVTETVKKRVLIVTLDFEGQHPVPLKLEAINEKCNLPELDEIRIGDIITVSANLRGSNWNNPKSGLTEVINSFNLWKIEINRTTAKNNAVPVYEAPTGGFAPPAQQPVQSVVTQPDYTQLPNPEDTLPF